MCLGDSAAYASGKSLLPYQHCGPQKQAEMHTFQSNGNRHDQFANNVLHSTKDGTHFDTDEAILMICM